MAPRFLYAAAVAGAIALGLWLRWDALQVPLMTDDFVALGILDGVYPGDRHPLDQFNFIDGSEADRRIQVDAGTFPWWSSPQLRLSMMRPGASLMTLLDWRLLGGDARALHAHSLLWWALLVAVVAALLGHVLPRRVAALAVLMFALKEGHNLPIVWVANRSALMAMTCAFLGLWMHVRRRDQGLEAGWASAAAFALGLCFGEWAFPVLGYVLAYELLNRSPPQAERLRALLPAALPAALFLLLRASLGYGVRQSQVYIDPLDEPSAFLVASLERIPVFFGDLFFGVSSTWWLMGSPWYEGLLGPDGPAAGLAPQLPSWQRLQVGLGLLAMLTALIMARWAASDGSTATRRARWLMLGSLFALVPVVGSFPTSRLVLPAAVATSALLAAVMLSTLRYAVTHLRRTPLRALMALALATAVGYVHLARPALSTAPYIERTRAAYESGRRWVLESDMDPTRLAQQDVVVLAASDQTTAFWAPMLLHHHGLPRPRSWRTLSTAPHAQDLHRPADNVLELTTVDGSFRGNELWRLYRGDSLPLRPGFRDSMPGLQVEVTRERDNEPTRVRFQFDRSLDDPGLLFLTSTVMGLRRAPIPEVGGTRRIAQASDPNYEALDLYRRWRDPLVACSAALPGMSECRLGVGYAECNGFGAPLFACHGAMDCRWFARGCVPRGYEPTTCPSHDLCCHDGAPFAHDGSGESSSIREAAWRTLQAWGMHPQDGFDHAPVAVHFTPALRPAAMQLACSGPRPPGGPCSTAALESLQEHEGALAFIVAGARPSGDGWALSVEALRDRQGRFHAGVCRLPRRQQTPKQCPSRDLRADCAVQGELELSRLPHKAPGEPLGARLTARFADGSRIALRL